MIVEIEIGGRNFVGSVSDAEDAVNRILLTKDARIAELEAQVDFDRTLINAIGDKCKATEAERDQALSELAAARADKERIDYLEAHHIIGAVIWKGKSELGWLVMGQRTTYATLRLAIDAARAAAGEKA